MEKIKSTMLFVIALITTFVSAQSIDTPTHDYTFDGQVKWMLLTETGTLLASTGEALVGIKPNSKELAFKIDRLKKVKEEYLHSARNMGITEMQIYKTVIWKSIQPAVTKKSLKIHSYIWMLILVFEFIGNESGFGFVYRQLLEFNDFTSIFSLSIVIALIILIGNLLINYIRSKTIFWEP